MWCLNLKAFLEARLMMMPQESKLICRVPPQSLGNIQLMHEPQMSHAHTPYSKASLSLRTVFYPPFVAGEKQKSKDENIFLLVSYTHAIGDIGLRPF